MTISHRNRAAHSNVSQNPISKRKGHSNLEVNDSGTLKKNGRKGGTKKFRRRKLQLSKDEAEKVETAKDKSFCLRSSPHSKLTHPKPLQEEKDQKNGDKKKQSHRKMTKKDRPKLAEDTQIRCIDGLYAVDQLLGSGGFGDVYKVRKVGTNEYYAMKTELHEFNGKKIDRLRVEVAVMSLFSSVKNPERRKHFVDLFDKGQTDTFKLVVMQLLGPSIEDLRRFYLCADFTKPTAMRISQQTLQGIWDLHLVGFIHRDIKPQNFAIGTGDKDDIIYILDLGIAHRYIDRHTNKIKPPRSKVRFMGTIRYASRNCHRSKEQSRKDDLETWIYMSVELYSSMILPWKRFIDRQAVLVEKDKFFTEPNAEIYRKAPQGYRSISKYVDNLTYEEEPNYTLIQSALEQIIKDECIDIRLPLDWTGKVLEKDERDSRRRAKEKEAIERKKGGTRESKDVSLEKDEEPLEQVNMSAGEKQKNSPQKESANQPVGKLTSGKAENIRCSDLQINSEYL
uniref:Protein kinase domain-containing protein n=1 Tax=Parascaris univalens TaxID=6257 RepID=A0A915BGS8_PARUN